jgi:glycerol uptake facilitator protein
MNAYIAEILGTCILVLLGNGVVANVVLKGTKGHQGGWIVIATGWGLAVFVAVFIVSPYSGAHINPAVTVALSISGQFPWSKVPAYIACQMIGAMTGALLVYTFYLHHFKATVNTAEKTACFYTTPAIRKIGNNFISEVIGTCVLVLGVLYISGPVLEWNGNTDQIVMGLGALDALPVGLLVLAIGLSLGGTTGYAINPARDLGPRIVYALIHIKTRRSGDWPYALVPVLGPLTGATIAAILFSLIGR